MNRLFPGALGAVLGLFLLSTAPQTIGKPGTDGWRHVPEAARETFPSVARILADGRVHLAGPRR